MRRVLTPLLTFLLLLVPLGAVPAAAAPDTTGTACLVADVGGFENPFSGNALEGAEKAALRFHVELLAFAPETEFELPDLVEGLVVAGTCDLIIGIGFIVGGVIEPLVLAYPHQLFSVVDQPFQPVDAANLRSVGFQVDEPSFLAGYLAAGLSATGTVGVYGGWDYEAVTIFMDGYALGVDYFNAVHGTDVEVLGWDPQTRDGIFTFDFQNPGAGYEVTMGLFDEGADTVFAVAGPTGEGSLAAAAERKAAGENVRVIEPDFDYFDVYSDPYRILLTSVLKNTDVATYHLIKALATGTWTPGLVWEDLASEGVGLARFHKTNSQVPGSLRIELKLIRRGIIDGSIPTLP